MGLLDRKRSTPTTDILIVLILTTNRLPTPRRTHTAETIEHFYYEW